MYRNSKRNAIAVTQGRAGAPNDPINDLANAIIVSAANDYRSCCKRRKRLSKQNQEKRQIREALFNVELKISRIEQFFRSDWCFALSGGTNIAILERLRREQE